MPSVYSYETNNRTIAEALSRFLRMNGVSYERSSGFNGYYFSISATPADVENIDSYLDSVYLAGA